MRTTLSMVLLLAVCACSTAPPEPAPVPSSEDAGTAEAACPPTVVLEECRLFLADPSLRCNVQPGRDGVCRYQCDDGPWNVCSCPDGD